MITYHHALVMPQYLNIIQSYVRHTMPGAMYPGFWGPQGTDLCFNLLLVLIMVKIGFSWIGAEGLACFGAAPRLKSCNLGKEETRRVRCSIPYPSLGFFTVSRIMGF